MREVKQTAKGEIIKNFLGKKIILAQMTGWQIVFCFLMASRRKKTTDDDSKLAQKSTFGSDETERGLNITWHKKNTCVFGVWFSTCGPEGCGSVLAV